MSTNEVRFGEIVKSRREELNLSQIEVWSAGGPSNSTLTKIESGDPGGLSRKTYRLLDEVLRWESGSAKRARDGGDPTPLDERVPRTPRTDEERKLVQAIREAEIDKRTRESLLRVLGEEDAG